MTKRYAVPAFSLVTFLPCMVSPIVKPGPTVPLTVFAVAAEPLPVAARATATIAAKSHQRVRVLAVMSFASLGHELGDRARDRIARSSKARTVIRTVEAPRTFPPGLGHDVVVEVEHV